MRLMEINKREFYYSSYIDIDELVDEYGNLTGEFAYIYSDPVLARGNYSSTKGESLTTMFGDFDGYDRVLVTDIVLNEQTRLWIDDRNPDNAHDYEVVKVGDSINYNAYAIKKVRVAEPFYARVYGMNLTDDKGFTLTDGDKIRPSVIKRLDYLRLEHEGDASAYRLFTFSEVGGSRKLEYVVADLITRNYLINSAPVVEFGEDIATSVQDFEGRNLFLAKNINLGSPSFISYQDGRYYLYSQSDGGPPTHTGLYTSLGIMTSRSEHLSKLIEVEPSTSYYFQVIEQDPEEVAGPLSVGEYASNGSNVRPVYSIPSVTNNIISYSSTRYIEVCRQSASFSMKNIMISKDNLYPYQPAPEDLTFATDYTLSEPLEIGETYTLTADTQAEWVGVWQGTDYFLGYLDDGKLTFEATAEETEIILKSYEGEQVGKVALRKGDTAWPWTPAPENSIALVEVDGINYVALDPKAFNFPDWDFTINMVAFAPDKDIVRFWCYVPSFIYIFTDIAYFASGKQIDTSESYSIVNILTFPNSCENVKYIEANEQGEPLVGGRVIDASNMFDYSGYWLQENFAWPKWDFILTFRGIQ